MIFNRAIIYISMVFALGAHAGGQVSARWPLASFTGRVMNAVSSLNFYGPTPGFHHGLDIEAPALSEVYAPVSGKIAARYYYPPHPSNYTFEISITELGGKRWELHHIDKSTIPAEILAMAEAGEEIDAGTYLGRVFDGRVYEVASHLHINVLIDGFYHEPQLFLPLPQDQIAPQFKRIFILGGNGVREINNLELKRDELTVDSVLLVEAFDQGQVSKLPVYSFQVVESGSSRPFFSFNFANLPFADFLKGVEEFYHLPEVVLGSGEKLKSNPDQFFYRVPLKDLSKAASAMDFVVKDIQGNSARLTLSIYPSSLSK